MNPRAERIFVLLGYAVTVATVVGFIVAAVVFVAGVVTSPLELALIGALLMSLAANAYLLLRRRRRSSPDAEWVSPWSAEEIEEFEANSAQWEEYQREQEAIDRDEETAWFEKPSDLTTLKTTPEELDKYLATATAWAKRNIGPDAKLAFFSWKLNPSPIYLAFRGWSAVAGRRFGVMIRGPRDAHVSEWMRARDDVEDRPAPEPPWRRDDRWRSLIERTWLRERPFTGKVHLRWFEEDEGGPAWEICYERAAADDVHFPRSCWTLEVDGQIVRSDGSDTSVTVPRDEDVPF